MGVVERFRFGVRRLHQQIQTTRRQLQPQIRNLPEDVAHRHIERVSLAERKPAKVIDKVSVEGNALFVVLLDELRDTQTQRITRLGLNAGKELAKPSRNLFVD